MARKLVENNFFEFLAPPPQKINIIPNKYLSIIEKIKVVKNFLKWRENWPNTIFWFLNHNPPLKIAQNDVIDLYSFTQTFLIEVVYFCKLAQYAPHSRHREG